MTNEKLSRRKVLVALAATGAGAALVGTAQANVQSVPDDVQEQKAKLQNVLEHVEIADAKITRLATAWQDPPEPTWPQFDALRNDINSECQKVMSTINELLLRRGA
jgi:hypothetical protein